MAVVQQVRVLQLKRQISPSQYIVEKFLTTATDPNMRLCITAIHSWYWRMRVQVHTRTHSKTCSVNII